MLQELIRKTFDHFRPRTVQFQGVVNVGRKLEELGIPITINPYGLVGALFYVEDFVE